MALIFSFLLFLLPSLCLGQTALPENLWKENKRFLSAKEKNEVDAAKFSAGLKEWYWKAYEGHANSILAEEKTPSDLAVKQEEMSKLKEGLSDLEHREGDSDKLEEKVTAHLKLLQDKVYSSRAFVSLDYITWQSEALLKSSSQRTTLILTNHGYCGGGGWGKKNAFNYFFVDGCLLFGYGNVGTTVNNVTYKQSNIPIYGGRASAGATRTVSSLGADVGLKLSVLYTVIDLDRPDRTDFPGYTVREGEALMPLLSLVTSWPVMKGFIRTEFAHALDKDLTLWALGLGYNF